MFKLMNRYWRIFSTGLSFIVFGLGGLFLSFFVFPIVLVAIQDPLKKKKVIRKIITLTFRFFMNFMHTLGVIRFKTESIETLHSENSCLLIANHPTLIDVVSIIAHCPNACCIVKEELWSNTYVRKIVQAAGYIPNTDADLMLKRCEEAISNGDVLIIFPEGTRTKPNEEPKFQRGAAHIALMLKCEVRCVEINCSPITLTKGLPWYRVPSRRADFTLSVRDRINSNDHVLEDMPRPKAARVITRVFLKQYCSTP